MHPTERRAARRAAMSVTLRKATDKDIEKIWKMQVEAFAGLLEKYQDYDMSPAAVDNERAPQ